MLKLFLIALIPIVIIIVFAVYVQLTSEKGELTKGPWYIAISEIHELGGIKINDSEIIFKDNYYGFGNSIYKYKIEVLKEPIKFSDTFTAKKIIIQNPDKMSNKLRLYITNSGKIVQEAIYLRAPLINKAYSEKKMKETILKIAKEIKAKTTELRQFNNFNPISDTQIHYQDSGISLLIEFFDPWTSRHMARSNAPIVRIGRWNVEMKIEGSNIKEASRIILDILKKYSDDGLLIKNNGQVISINK